MGKSHLGNVKIDKAYLGVEGVSAIYLGSEKVYPNTVFYEKYSLKWDVSIFRTYDSSLEILNNYLAYKLDGSKKAVTNVTGKPNAGIVKVGDVLIVQAREQEFITTGTTYGYLLTSSVRDDTAWRAHQFNTSVNEATLLNSRIKDAFIETVEAVDGTYPDDGVQDGFYYIKI